MAKEQVELELLATGGDRSASQISRVTKSLNDVKSSALLMGGAFVGVVAGVKKAVDAFKVQQRVVDQTNRVIASTGMAAGLTAQEIGNMARALQKTTGVSDEVTQSAQNILLTFTNLKKDIFPGVTKTVLDMTAAMNHGEITQENLKMSAIQLGKALNDPAKGLTALTRVGVSFSEEQKEQIKTMQSVGDTAGAQAVMLAELQKEFGGTSENLNTLVGAQRAADAAFGDMLEVVGSAFAPVMAAIAKTIRNVADTMSQWLPTIKGLIVPITAVVAGFTGLVAAVGAFTFLAPSIAATWAVITGPIGLTIAGITGIVLAFKNWSEIMEWLSGLWSGFKDMLISGVKSLVDIFTNFGQVIKLVMGGKFSEAVALAKETFVGLKDGVVETFGELGTNIVDGTANIVNSVVEMFGKIKTSFQDTAESNIKTNANMLNKQEQQQKKHVTFQQVMDQLLLKSKMSTADAMASILSNGAELMNSSNKEAFRVGKAFAIAQATINAIAAAQSVAAALSGIPVVGPSLAVVGAATALAAGMANVSRISAQQMPAAEFGGLIPGSNAGTTLIAGEKGKSEAIIPLEGEGAERLRENIGSGIGHVTINIENVIAESFVETIDKQLEELRVNRGSVFAIGLENNFKTI